MEITRRYFCYNKSCRSKHEGEVAEMKLIGTVGHFGPDGKNNLYQCLVCMAVKLIQEEVPNSPSK